MDRVVMTLQQARNLLAERWGQGAWYARDTDHYCLVGGLAAVTGCLVTEPFLGARHAIVIPPVGDAPTFGACINLLAACVDLAISHDHCTEDDAARCRLVEYNDRHAEHDDILDLIDRALAVATAELELEVVSFTPAHDEISDDDALPVPA